MSDGTETGLPMTDATEATTTDAETATDTDEATQQTKQEQTDTRGMVPQSEVDRIVRERVARERGKFADYDDLKAKAGQSTTLEERLADVERRAVAAETNALRSSIAAEFGVSTKKGPKGEPSDADLFLTGTDESTLTAQAQRLIGREADRKKQGNVAPKEGATHNSGDTDKELRDFAGRLFGKSD